MSGYKRISIIVVISIFTVALLLPVQRVAEDKKTYNSGNNDSDARIPTEFIAASQTNEETDDIAENLGQACVESISDHKGCKKDPDNVSHF